MATHVMLDLETMGTAAGSPIIAIGAVAFDLCGEALTARFCRAITLASNMQLGLTPDAGTIEFWLKQGDAARASLFPEDRLDLRQALDEFATWLCVWDDREIRIWSHGPAFDIALLEVAYRAAGMRTPWRYSAARDTRTVYDLAEVDVLAFRAEGTRHSALDDAVAQARALQAACRKLGIVAKPAEDLAR